MKPKKSLSLAILAASAASANAQLTWVAPGGTGNWNTTTANWTPPATPTVWINNSDAIFTAAATASLTGPIGLDDVTTTGTGDKLINSSVAATARTITLAFTDGSSEFNITGNKLTCNADTVLAGTGTLVKSGTSLLHLQGASTFTGDIRINSGQIQINSDSGLGNTGNDIFLNTGTLQQNSGTAITLPAGRTIHLGDGTTAATGTFNTFGRTINVAGVIQNGGAGAGGLTKTGTVNGVLELRAANTYSGTTTHQQVGILRLTTSGTFGNGVGDLDLNGSACVAEISRTSDYTLANPIIGANTGAKLRQIGAGRTILNSNVSTYAGIIEITNGVLELQAGNTAGAAVLNVSDGALEVTGDVTQSGVPAADSTITASGVLRGMAKLERNVNVTGSVEPGTIATPITSTFGVKGNLTFSAAGTISLDVNGPNIDKIAVIGNLTGDSTVINVPFLGTPTPGTYDIITYTGTLLGTFVAPGGMTLDTSTSGVIKLTIPVPAPENLTWTGATDDIWDVSTTFNWNDGAGAEVFEALDNVTFSDSGANKAITLITSVQPTSVTYTNTTTNDYSLSGTGGIDGPTGITKIGNGVVTLSTANNFNGNVAINAGTIVVNSGTALGNTIGTTSIAASGTVSLLADADVSESFSGGGAFIRDGSAVGRTVFGSFTGFTGTVSVKASNRLAFNPTSGSAGMPTGATSFTVEDSASLRFRQSASFGPGTSFALTGVGFAAGSPPGTLIADNTSTVNIDGPITMTAGASNTCTITSDVSSTLTLNGSLSGNVNLLKEGSSSLILNNAATYTGTTRVNNGTLQLGTTPATGALPANPIIKIGKANTGAVLLLNGHNQTVVGLKGTGSGGGIRRISNGNATAITLTANITTLDPDFNEDGTADDSTIWNYAHTLGDPTLANIDNRNLAFVKTGALGLQLGGTHYDGTTTLNAGVTGFTNVASTLTQPITVNSTATIMGSASLPVEVIVKSGATINPGNLIPVTPPVTSLVGTVGTLGVTKLTMETGSTFAAQLDSSTSTMDRVNSPGGAVVLGSAALTLTDLAAVPAALPGGTKFVLINYTGQTLSGTFNGIAEGSTIVVGLNTFKIRYADTTDAAANAGLFVTLQVESTDAYVTWASSKGLVAPNDAFEADPDNDGIKNGLEFVLGGEPNPANPGSNSSALLPTVSQTSGNLTFSFKRKDISEGASTVTFQWSTDLVFPPANDIVIGATSVTPAPPAVSYVVTEDLPDGDTDTINITVPAANAVGGKIFGRLKATKP